VVMLGRSRVCSWHLPSLTVPQVRPLVPHSDGGLTGPRDLYAKRQALINGVKENLHNTGFYKQFS